MTFGEGSNGLRGSSERSTLAELQGEHPDRSPSPSLCPPPSSPSSGPPVIPGHSCSLRQNLLECGGHDLAVVLVHFLVSGQGNLRGPADRGAGQFIYVAVIADEFIQW